MKRWMVIVGLLAVSCHGPEEHDLRSFIPGMYVRVISHEFAHGSDTVIIAKLSENTYSIQKRAGFTRIRQRGKELPPIYRTENWTGIYDESSGVIREQQKGKVLSFAPKENRLYIGGSPYQKVKP